MRTSMPACRSIMLCALIFVGGTIVSSGRKGRLLGSAKPRLRSSMPRFGSVMDDDDMYAPDLKVRATTLR